MADLPVQPVLNYGQMLGSYGESLANQENATTNNLSARAQIPSIQAGTALTQAQTQGANLANQRSAAQLAMLQSLMAPPVVNDQSAPASADTSGAAPSPTASKGNSDTLEIHDGGIDKAAIDSGIQSQFAVKDQWTPQELQKLQMAQSAEIAGLPNMTANVKLQHDARIQNLTNQAQLGASKAYDQSYAVSTAPDGNALPTLAAIHPDAAAAIKKIADAKDWTPAQTDQYVRTYADEVGNQAHRYSGRDVEVGSDGIARDKTTNQPVLNGAPTGLSAEQHASLVKEGSALTSTFTNGVESKVPQYKASGFSSLNQYVNAAANRNSTAATPPSAVTSAAPAPTATPPVQAAPKPAAAPPVVQTSDPVLKQALSDPEFRYTPPKIAPNQAMDPDSSAKIAASNEARKGLLADAQSATKAAQQAQVYLNAAKAITDSGGTPTGAGAAAQAKVEGVLGALGWKGGAIDAGNYQEAVKYLGNAAIQAQKSNFPNATQSEVGLTLNELNPSLKMTPKAVGDLIDENLRNTQYTIDSAHRVGQYLTPSAQMPNGGDPQRFNDWNGKHFNQSKAVNAPASAANNTPKTMPPAAKLQAYATAHFGGDTKKATAFLNSEGYK